MTLGWIVVYRLPPGTAQKERVKFGQDFWGQTTTSHGGRYKFHREGLMESVPHRKLANGVFLLRKGDLELVEGFLKERGAIVARREVRLEAEDLGLLEA